jgi:hypothetical protein
MRTFHRWLDVTSPLTVYLLPIVYGLRKNRRTNGRRTSIIQLESRVSIMVCYLVQTRLRSWTRSCLFYSSVLRLISNPNLNPPNVCHYSEHTVRSHVPQVRAPQLERRDKGLTVTGVDNVRNPAHLISVVHRYHPQRGLNHQKSSLGLGTCPLMMKSGSQLETFNID